MTIAEFLKENRMTQAEFAREVDSTEATISRLRRRLVMPHLDLAMRIVSYSQGKITFDDLQVGTDRGSKC